MTPLAVIREICDVALRAEGYASAELLSAEARGFAQQVLDGAKILPQAESDGGGVLGAAAEGRGGER